MTSISALLLQNDAANAALGGGLAAIGGMMLLFWLAIVVVAIVGMWKVFTKAGQPGWAVLVPFYNIYVMTQIAGRPGWWLLLFFIPFVNIAIAIVLAIDIAKAFGQSAEFGVVLLFLLSIVGYLILGFGNYQYRKPVLAAAA